MDLRLVHHACAVHTLVPYVLGITTHHVGSLGPMETSDLLCLDSGAKIHVSCDRSLFTAIHPPPSKTTTVYDAGRHAHDVVGIGTICITCRDVHDRSASVQIDDVRYVPSIRGTYLDTTRLRSKGWSVYGNNKGVWWVSPNDVILKATIRNGNEFIKIMDPYTTNLQVNGIVSHDFVTRINSLSLDELFAFHRGTKV